MELGKGQRVNGVPNKPEQTLGCSMFLRFKLVADKGLEILRVYGGSELTIADFLFESVGGRFSAGGQRENLNVAKHVIFNGREGYGTKEICISLVLNFG